MKFHENLPSWSRVVPCCWTERQTERHDESVAFRRFANAPKMEWGEVLNLFRSFCVSNLVDPVAGHRQHTRNIRTREGTSAYKMRAARPFQESCSPVYFPFLSVLKKKKKLNDRKYVVSQVYDYQNRIRRFRREPHQGWRRPESRRGGAD